MKFLLVEDDKKISCCFEEWKKDSKKLGPCGKPAASYLSWPGNKPLCLEHLTFVADAKATFFTSSGEVESRQFLAEAKRRGGAQ